MLARGHGAMQALPWFPLGEVAWGMSTVPFADR